ncbi:hypothetical protein EJM73_09100 [Clostridium botulinum]|uniref:hypothetical protein n=1 Tax=Clostridium botulinum TaxID=1491 RepID=UPI00137552D0|nr:hypothetical protein [Clostridium botulinum]NCI19782.1 hypothetical protein [Clostridium botulinum]NCI35820.1 hypothetical protein [Clostridium botulinum]NCI71677.1 hypothetical protein [Clostridium botulinum]NDI38869.1 hypothetical protein [Clostridium botulinum]
MFDIASEISKLKHLKNNFYIVYNKRGIMIGLSNKFHKKYICKSCLDVSEPDLQTIYINILNIEII